MSPNMCCTAGSMEECLVSKVLYLARMDVPLLPVLWEL